MRQISKINNYELMVIFSSDYSDIELKERAIFYSNKLKKLGASSIVLTSRGYTRFAYRLKNYKTGYFVEIYFTGIKKISTLFQEDLKIDKNIFRYTLKTTSKK